MNNKDLLLAIDNGTQSVKALVFDLAGNLLAKERVHFDPYFSEHPGWAEQDPEVFWESLCIACRRLFEKMPSYRERIAGVSLTTQRATVLNVDKEGKPLRPAILWLDQRKTYGLPPLGGFWGMLFTVTNLKKTIDYFRAEAEANWIMTYNKDVWNKTHKYLLLSGYLTHRLTGRFADSVGCQVGYIPFDYRNLTWAKSWDWKWKGLPIQPDLLPELIPVGKPIGNIGKLLRSRRGFRKDFRLLPPRRTRRAKL